MPDVQLYKQMKANLLLTTFFWDSSAATLWTLLQESLTKMPLCIVICSATLHRVLETHIKLGCAPALVC